MHEDITVYSYRRCPFAMRVRMTLHEKSIPFRVIEEDLKNFSEKLKKLHPEACVPLLIHGDTVVYESAIITEYLDDQFPENALMPQNALDKMRVRQWTYWCNHIFKPEIDRFKYGEKKLTANERENAIKTLAEHLKKIETQLKNSPWLVGDKMTLADIHVFPFFRQLSKVTPSHPHLEQCKSALAWLEKIISRPAFEKTMAKNPS